MPSQSLTGIGLDGKSNRRHNPFNRLDDGTENGALVHRAIADGRFILNRRRFSAGNSRRRSLQIKERQRVAPMCLFLVIPSLFLGFMTATQAGGGDWIPAVFPERAFDFGNVARGSQVRHAFPVVNRTNSDVHIAGWRTKCGCTNVKFGARSIPPGTQTTIEATIDTTRFQGAKASGLTLVIDRPSAIEVELNMTCFIRTDIDLVPGQIDFGTVGRSDKLPSAALTLTYRGANPSWEIAQMKTQGVKVKAIAERLNRAVGGSNQWTVTATLQPDITNGYFKDQITVITNDSPPQSIPISVVANIHSAVRVTPSIINFGPVRVGQSVSKTVHVRSSSPFTITKLDADRADLAAVDQQSGSTPDHTVNVTLQAPAEPGPFHGIVKIESDLKDEPVAQIKTFATIMPAP